MQTLINNYLLSLIPMRFLMRNREKMFSMFLFCSETNRIKTKVKRKL